MQGTFRETYWPAVILGVVQHEDTREIIHLESRALEVVALDMFAKNGWRSNNRICI
jgi:hypothetical protein